MPVGILVIVWGIKVIGMSMAAQISLPALAYVAGVGRGNSRRCGSRTHGIIVQDEDLMSWVLVS